MNASLQLKRAQGFTERVSGISPLRTCLLALSLCSFEYSSPSTAFEKISVENDRNSTGVFEKGESVPMLLLLGTFLKSRSLPLID